MRPPEEILEGLLAGDRVVLSRAITLIESVKEEHRELAQKVIRLCLQRPQSKTLRIGISGVPGVGKSTFIEALGLKLCEEGHKVAVLSVDPSSSRTGGSILGDKTRMTKLATEPAAFIRPSPSRLNLGGVTGRCWETVVLCEVAGFDRILIETVGVGQSEIGVRSVADFFLLLQMAGGGDELQGIKKGIVEMVDAILINKADGNNELAAKLAGEEIRQVLRMLQPFNPNWKPVVSECSGLTRKGLDEASEMLNRFSKEMVIDHRLEKFRKSQEMTWFETTVREEVVNRVLSERGLSAQLAEYVTGIEGDEITGVEAFESLLRQLQIQVRLKPEASS